MKKIILTLLIFTMLIAVFSSCERVQVGLNGPSTKPDDTPKEEGIKIDATGVVELDVGKTAQLKAINLATEMETSNVNWTSDNEAVAAVDSRGTVTGVSEGSAIISATTIDGEYSASCTVVVTLRLTGVEIDYEYYDMEIGETAKLSASPIPGNFVGASYTWMSSVPSVATVDNEGNITALALGTTSIMVEAAPGEYTAICTVVVGKKAQSISLKPTSLKLYKGESEQLDFSVSPSDATSRIFWTSSNEKVAIVNSGGTVTAIGSGSATITMSTTNGLIKTCKVTVTAVLEEIHFDIDEVVLQKGDKLTINVTYVPSDATNKTLTWTSSDPSVAKVEKGVVYALSNGFVTIKAESESGSCVAECKILINNPLKSLAFEGTLDKNTGKYPTISMQCTDAMKAPIVADPIDADELESLIWEVSDPKLLKISSDGTMTALAEGTVTVKVSSTNGFTASCDVEITRKIYNVEQIVVTSPEYYMNPGDKINIGLTYLPIESVIDAKLYSVVSSNMNVASYDGFDSIIAYNLGSCEIVFTVVNYDGTQIQLVVKVTVVENGTSFDSEYKADIHALRDGELYTGLAEALDTLERLTKEKEELLGKLAAETDPALIAEYNLRLAEVENGIKLAGESENYYREKIASAEAELKAKYSAVDTTYDPDKDPYPNTTDSDFVKVSDYIDNLVTDLKYAGIYNETGHQIYTFTEAYLRYGTVQKLANVAKLLKEQGYSIVIWDAYRPAKAQDLIWKLVGISDLDLYSSSRGNSLYITIVNADGTPLEMPSGYGDKSAASDRDYSDVTENAGANALYLETLMTANGFTAGAKWWQFTDSVGYEIEKNFLADSVVTSVEAN
ncbi:MAG: hypothetical protein E7633_05950 [Ruminococcaceae bacterium]|nr:hypothetical protein [Oscillospiraceae bacterium]